MSENERPQQLRRNPVPCDMMDSLQITQIDHDIKREPTQLRSSIRDLIELPKPCDSSESEIL